MNDSHSHGRLIPDTDDDQRLAQIREILFGDQQRQTAQQIAALEARLDNQDNALRHLLDQRIHQALDGLRSEVDKQSLRQQTALDGLDNALRSLLAKTEDRVTLLDSELQEVAHALRQTLDRQATTQDRLERHKVERAQLAELLEAMARQLREQGT